MRIVRYSFLCYLSIVYNVICSLLDFEKPSAIQQRAIVPITKGRDVIAQSQSGTGKTGRLINISIFI